MTDTVVAEGQVKFRDGKKWKTRWVVLRKPSPVAGTFSLCVCSQGICGVEPACGFDGVSYSLSVLCLSHTLVLGFSSREALQAWDARIRFHLGEAHRFSVSVEPGAKVESGPASLHLCNSLLVLTRGLPPVVTGHWKLSALRRYGAVPNGFVFEGGSRCGYWAGVYYLSCSEGEQISFLVDCIVRGIAPSRTLQGLRPALSDADPVSAEEKILHETSELEKRLSRLSNCSLASSTGKHDDHSSLSSSSSSQSEASYGPRLPFWPESLSRLHSANDAASNYDRLYAAAGSGGAGTRPSSAQLHSRGLHDSGRQSSLDSGISIAPGSQSSGSLDAAFAPGAEEYGSAPSLASAAPSPLRLPHRNHTHHTCPRLRPLHLEEYHVPSQLRSRYDTPKSLLQSLMRKNSPTPNPTSEPSQDSPNSAGHWWIGGPPRVIDQRFKSRDSEERSAPRPQSVPACLFHGRTQVNPRVINTNYKPNHLVERRLRTFTNIFLRNFLKSVLTKAVSANCARFTTRF
uniref:Docking protein 7 n=1 Tax=Neogobius melanostomus TaxID=47308 RepID=A0A8C6WIN4_9GOBI